MNTSEEYNQPALEALSSFVRKGAKTETCEGPPAADIQAALTVIGRRKLGGEEPDLTSAHILKADLFIANLFLAHLSGADLSGAMVTQSQLDQACGTNAKLDPGLTLNRGIGPS
jgi:hypothetical protein